MFPDQIYFGLHVGYIGSNYYHSIFFGQDNNVLSI